MLTLKERYGLTKRETEVMLLLGLGLRNEDIAARLFLAKPTIKTNVSSAYRKMGVPNRVSAAIVVYEACQ